MPQFNLQSDFKPAGDQPEAIKALLSGIQKNQQQTLLGVTGSGKTFTMANVIQELQQPTLILTHNKTLTAQLYQEFKDFFPHNKVCFFVSYYDYYQPESYLPHSDTYIEKDAKINETIERLRMEAAASLLTRQDVIVVSSVSCIYGFGQPDEFAKEAMQVKSGKNSTIKSPRDLARMLVGLQFERNDLELRPGRFRVKGDTVEIVQGSGTTIIRVEFFGEEIEKMTEIDPANRVEISKLNEIMIWPARPYVIPEAQQVKALKSIREEMRERIVFYKDKPLEAHRIEQRTNYDLEMIEQLGYCKGVENYSRHFDGRDPGSPPYTLVDFFNYASKDWLLFIDESHQSVPQIGGMYHGDRSRKQALIDYGFRLPSAYDNRPLKFNEFETRIGSTIYVSATPGDYELERSKQVVEQIIRPTGLVDPPVEIRGSTGQLDDLMGEIKEVTLNGWRTLVTTLTKRMAEELTEYLQERGIKSEYMHSEIDTLERTEIIQRLRQGKIDVLVGINLLREGLDLPEVALVAIIDADKEGFLRNKRSLIQTAGRAARNVESKVILYADKETGGMKEAIQEMDRRRKLQQEHNKKHKITPKSIVKNLAAREDVVRTPTPSSDGAGVLDDDNLHDKIVELEEEMLAAAETLDFEKAMYMKIEWEKLKKQVKK
ncbi:excinuclease ABC subunit B [bacterium]|nr:excinuclease ABC subunit B [bacterium]